MCSLNYVCLFALAGRPRFRLDSSGVLSNLTSWRTLISRSRTAFEVITEALDDEAVALDDEVEAHDDDDFIAITMLPPF